MPFVTVCLFGMFYCKSNTTEYVFPSRYWLKMIWIYTFSNPTQMVKL